MIVETDLAFLKSQRLTDASNGGGLMTGEVVVDGQLNNLFNDISSADRTYGRVSLRKCYIAVQSDNSDPFLGVLVIVTDAPDDAGVDVVLFSTGSWTDVRDAHRNYIENYSIAGPESRWLIYGDQIAGQRMLLLYSVATSTNAAISTTDPTPDVGDVMILSVEKSGYTAIYQAVRVTKIVSRALQQFNDGSSVFYKDVLTLQISNPLRYTFAGAVPNRLLLPRSHPDASPTLLRKTTVADASVYYGVKALAAPAEIGDLSIQVSSVYATLVPSAESETPVLDQSAGLTAVNYVQSSSTASLSASATLNGTSGNNYTSILYLGRGIMPGTLSVTIGGVAYKDDSKGGLVLANSSAGTYAGVVDYVAGSVSPRRTTAWTAVVSASATPCVPINDNTVSASILVSVNNRFYVYVFDCSPVPTPGALVVDFRALGKWYRLTDNGAGRLVADAQGIGSGTINYATGGVAITLDNLPDIGSNIVFAWATPNRYQIQTNVIAQPRLPNLKHTLVHVPIEPDSVEISWDGGKYATVGDDLAISGDATGYVNSATGEMVLIPTELPASGTDFVIAYNEITNITDVFTVTADGAGNFTITLSQTPVKPSSVNLTFTVFTPRDDLYSMETLSQFTQSDTQAVLKIADDGTGVIKGAGGGTINYATGVITVKATSERSIQKVIGFKSVPEKTVAGGSTLPAQTIVGLIDTTEFDKFPSGSSVTVTYALVGASTITRTETVSLSTLEIDLNTQNDRPLLAGSLWFSAAGTDYIDRDGVLYSELNSTNNSAVQSGTVDYESGIATLTSWSGSATNELALNSAVVALGSAYITSVSGRAPGSPLAVGQFHISATASNGDALSASADFNGKIDTEWMQGYVDWQMGWFEVSFGHYILDSAVPADVKTNSGWYDPANIRVDGTIFAPRYVKPETVTFNTVLISYIPLDADLLGLDNVRLPQDGRVPIYRIGSVVVIHNTERATLSNPVAAGSTYDMERVRLAYAKLYDADGLAVPTSNYTADLDAGTITMAAELDLSGYAQPLVCEHRIEDKSLVSDVQVTGDLALQQRLTHDFPADTTFVSSALMVGDLQARVSLIFDQYTWSNDWVDERSGDAAGGTYNDVLYPFALTNRGAIQERWAFIFTSPTAFNCFGEYSGLVGQGSINSEFAPVNPAQEVPYFVVNPLGWGGGWSSGNVLRVNTSGANYPIEIARVTKQSAASVSADSFRIEMLGDSN